MTDIRWINLVLDVPAHAMPGALEAWQRITGCTASAPLDDPARTRTMLPAAGASWLKVRTLSGDVPRVHMELLVDDVEQATRDALALGATVHERGDDAVVLRDPTGLRFALAPRHTDGDGVQVRDVDSLVDQICLDVPSNQFTDSVRFWSAFTGWPEAPGHYAEFTALQRPDDIPVRIAFQRVGMGEATGHPDVAARRGLLTRREHEAIGAVVDQVRERWTVMVGPSGMRYCITERNPVTGLFD